MTTNTETNVTPEVPAWLDLDGFCPPDLREQIAEAAGALEALVAYADPICREAYEVSEQYRLRRAECVIDDVDFLLGGLTGWSRFRDACTKLGALGACAEGDIASGFNEKEDAPDWYVPYRDRLRGDTEDERALVEWAAAEGKS